MTIETSAGKINFGLSGVGIAPQAMILPGVQTTYAGMKNKGGYTASEDGGPATSAKLNTPYGMAVAHTGDVYIADTNNQRIRKVAAATGIITTFAGNGIAGFRDGFGNEAEFFGLEAVALTQDQTKLWISDGNGGTYAPYNRVRFLPVQ